MPGKRILVAGLAGLAVVAASAALGAAALGAVGQEGVFSVRCDLTHRLPDDPIVHPRQHGASHLHEFYGNNSTNANSTLPMLRASGTGCARPEDRSGYWIPTLYKYGKPVPASSITVYYRTGGRSPASVQPLPDGLQMIAGDADAKEVQDDDFVDWSCDEGQAFDDTVLGRGAAKVRLRKAKARVRHLRHRLRAIRGAGGSTAATKRSLRKARELLETARLDLKPSSLPSCPPGSRVHLSLNFPDCWNGSRLDSGDHKSHMAYSDYAAGELRCPPNHPVPVAAVTFSIAWPINDGRGARLASGLVKTMHGDVFSAWDPGSQAALVDRCLKLDVDCGSR